MIGIVCSQWIKHCLQHFLINIWYRIYRRKSIVLAIVLVSFILIAIQYTVSLHAFHQNHNQNQYHSHNHVLSSNNVNEVIVVINSTRNRSLIHRTVVNKFNVNSQGSTSVPALINAKKSSNDKLQDNEIYDKYGVKRTNVVNLNDNRPQYGVFHSRPIDSKQLKELNLRPIESNIDSGIKTVKQRYIPDIRLVHFDLKGAPPKLSFYKKVLPLLRQSGANGILLEYEDMFPFWGDLKAATAGNAYSIEDIKEFLELAKTHSFEVIPLVQTFGHLEFFLKLQEFRHLREVDDYPQALCPSKNASFTLIQKIIDQVMSLHPNSKWLHIGCDEVYHIGYCDKCRFRERDNLFLGHVARVAKYARDKYSVIPIIWDDMLRQIPTEKIKEFNLSSLGVEPMIWTYIKDVYRFIPYSQWMTLSEIFPHVWAASAFKGAFGETLTVPNIKMHLENNEAWLEVMAEQQKNFKSIRGIAITGWQRYDHLATLCELFPSGLPSLVINLLTNSEGLYDSKTIFKKFDKIMGCTSNNGNYYNAYSQNDVDFDNDPYLFARTANCLFPGSPIYRLMQHHTEAIKRVNDYLYDVTIHKAWLTDYNTRHNISSPFRIDEGLQEYSSVYYNLQALIRTAKDALKEVYDDYTVSEWIEQNIYPYLLKLEELSEKSANLKKAKVWPKRPLKPLEDLKRFIPASD